MQFKILLIAVYCFGLALMTSAAESTPPAAAPKAAAEAKAKAEAEAKAKAAAEAKAKAEVEAKAKAAAELVGQAYADALGKFEQALKDDKLDDAVAAAREMIKLSAEPGSKPWQPTPATYRTVLSKFAEKKVFGSKHSLAFYKEALANAATADERADLTFQQGLFLYRYALVDDKQALALIDSAFVIPGITPQKQIQLCQKAAERDGWENLEVYAAKALAYAKGDPVLQVGVYSWIMNGYRQAGRQDEIVPLYEKLLADKAFQEFRLKIGLEMVSYLNRTEQFEKSLAYLNQVLPGLQGADKLTVQKTLADTYRQAAARYYSAPDPEDLKLAINVLREIIKDIPPEKPLNAADYRLTIAELHVLSEDYPAAVAEANTVLALPELAQKHPGARFRAAYLLGQSAYAQEDYPKAVATLAPLWQESQAQAGRSKRDLLEMLIRSYCAVGDFGNAVALSDELLKAVNNHEQKRYQIYVDGLKQRAGSAP